MVTTRVDHRDAGSGKDDQLMTAKRVHEWGGGFDSCQLHSRIGSWMFRKSIIVLSEGFGKDQLTECGLKPLSSVGRSQGYSRTVAGFREQSLQ